MEEIRIRRIDPQSCKTLFAESIDIISAFTGKKIEPGKSLLIIDEIQESPNALAALKYFCEEMPDLAIIAAGSLLGLAVDRKGSFPVGKVNFLDVPPMSFNEFLLAMGEDARYEQIKHSDFERMRKGKKK